MKRFILFFFFLAVSWAYGQSNLQEYMTASREAYKAKDNKKFYDMIVAAHKLHPYHQGILYNAGIAAALNGLPDEAFSYLRKAILIKADYNLDIDDLASLRTLPQFNEIKTLQAELQQQVVHSDTAFIIRQKDLHIESIAPGERPGIFYLGSIHKRKIIQSDEKGNITDFTTSAQDGLTSVFGIKVDKKNNILWACASPMPEMENFDSVSRSGLFKYDLKSKKLIKRYAPATRRDHTFGDLTLDAKGMPFVSDSKNNVIYSLDDSGNLTEFFASDQFWSLQGLTFSDDGKYLFIADYVKGIFRLRLDDKVLIQLPAAFDLAVKSVDGLTFYKNNLIAIQNLVVPMRATAYKLNGTKDKLAGYEIIDRGHAAFNEPTIGCLLNDDFYYVANSLWSGYTQDHQLKPETQLQDVVILKTNLKSLLKGK